MTDFQQQAIKLAAQQQPLAWLEHFRALAANEWLAQPWPTRKTEHWKYTPLQGLQKTQLTSWGGTGIAANHVQSEFIPLDAHRLVFVNGVLDVANSTMESTYLVRFSQASAEQQALTFQLFRVSSQSSPWHILVFCRSSFTLITPQNFPKNCSNAPQMRR